MLYLKLNYCFFIKKRVFFEGAWASGGRGRGRGWKKPAAYNSKTMDDTKIEFGGVLKNHRLINFI